ncbi:Wall-associated kinase family protein [Rhynchospora pubera]|uniref:Wall-associated kinase family protein n=1 Tax=Rhynchospora pubera TaxID=906938 RepID=A0AAV8E7G7_9POAL|nr:Wall-associated kinase family protein [Rhynchospora pubera]
MLVYTSSLAKTKIDRIATQQPECHLSCGGVTILYPFGIGKGCFRNGFEITCELSNTTHKNYVPILAGTNLQVLNISLVVAEVQVQPLNGWQCYNQSAVQAYYSAEADLNPTSVYRISNTSVSVWLNWALRENNNCTEAKKNPELYGCRITASIVSLLVISLTIIFVYQKRRLRRERDMFFKKNKGIILFEQLVSRKVETMKIFTEEELARITNHFAMVIGRGGQGKVYKGILEDYREVAVKKSVPMLVYEFIPNGTLNSFLHESQLPISLETRLQICTESAKALAYLHFETARPILHGDVKSANILLDRNYMAKVSDFGTSKFLSLDGTQFATFVQGTFGYLDPEFMQSSRLTEKSDVYSFGVVILELITRKKAVYWDGNNERMCLAQLFVSAMRQNDARSTMFDQNIATEENLEVLVGVSELAEKCLRLSGEERPTMTEVVEQLKQFMAMLRATQETSAKPNEFFTVISVEPTEYFTVSASPSGDA